MYSNGQLIGMEVNLSAAWSRAFLTALAAPRHELAPFVVSIAMGADGVPVEMPDLRDALEACLADAGHQAIDKVATSIFPDAIWRRCRGNRRDLYEYYLKYLPDYVAMEHSKNALGTYFARLIAFTTNARTGLPEQHIDHSALRSNGNQLEFVITHCSKGRRRAMLQVSVFDPIRDHTGAAQQGFPCLQHATFVPDFHAGTLALNAFYATQQLFVKAYGNWLGLCRLGDFVAGQAGLRFAQLNCFAGVQKLDVRPRSGDLLDRLKDLAAASAESQLAACRKG